MDQRLFASLIIICGAACNGGNPSLETVGGDAGATEGGVARGGHGGAAEAGDGAEASVPEGSAGASGSPTGEDCKHAIPLADGITVGGVIDPPGDIDHYSFAIPPGEFVRFSANANPENSFVKVDTVITLLDAQGKTVATSDDAIPRNGTDSEVFFHAPAAAVYCVRVEDFSTFHGDTPEGKPSYYYELTAATLTNVKAENNRDEEPNDDLQHSQTVMEKYEGSALYSFRAYGMLAPQGDIDVFAFKVSQNCFNAALMPSGPAGYGSTLVPGVLRVMDVNGGTLARIDATKGMDYVIASTTNGMPHAIAIEWPTGTAPGDNDFYFLKARTGQCSSLEKEKNPGENDSMATAEDWPLDPPIAGSTMATRYINGFIDPDADIDYFRFNVPASYRIGLSCLAARAGAGLLGATFEFRDEQDEVLQAETETDSASVYWNDNYADATKPTVLAEFGGSYYLRVSASSHDVSVASRYFTCLVAAQP